MALEVGEFFAGIGLNRLGLGADQGVNMQDIYEELQDIENTLTDIDQDIQKLDADVIAFDCNVMSSGTDSDIATIENFQQSYNNFIGGIQMNFKVTCDPTQFGPDKCLQTWADDVLDHNTGVGQALTRIQQTLGGDGNPAGAIGQCMLKYPLAMNTTDTVFFENMYNYMNYYYNYQAVGALLLVEANRFKAWQTTGFQNVTDASDPSSYNAICTDIEDFCAGGDDTAECECDVGVYCAGAYAAVKNTYDSVTSQYELVGAPYTNHDMVTYYMPENPEANDPNRLGRVFPRSLSAFTSSSNMPKNRPETSACPDHVPTPLISPSGVCGVTTMDAVNTQQSYPAGLVSLNRSEWEITTSREWYSIANSFASSANHSDGLLHEYMASLGMEDMENKIFYMKDTFMVTVGENDYNNAGDPTNWWL
ncbi:MAG: hypothetical protein SGILL_009232 [Bacillariaceae sp.]